MLTESNGKKIQKATWKMTTIPERIKRASMKGIKLPKHSQSWGSDIILTPLHPLFF